MGITFKKTLISLIMIISMGEGLFAQTVVSDYKWKNRVIVLLSDNPENRVYIKQRTDLGNENMAMAERDLIILDVPSGKTGKADAVALKAAYGKDHDEFRIILIGKDGTQKLNSDTYVSPEKIFSLIDSMPMRRSEMRQQNKDN